MQKTTNLNYSCEKKYILLTFPVGCSKSRALWHAKQAGACLSKCQVFDMSEKKSYMPQSTAGLIRYFDSESGIKIKPYLVLAVGVGFGALVAIAKVMAVA